MFGPIRSVSTREERTQIEWHQPDGPTVALPAGCPECEYDREGNRIKTGQIIDGEFRGDVVRFLATKVKHFLVRRASRVDKRAVPASTEASIAEGDKLFGTDCSECHGNSGRKPTDAGRWMYPRAADLGAVEVQQYSDAELFWIVKNGIRLSGMPAFGRVESDEQIWDLVHFVRTLPDSTNPKSGGTKN